MKTFIIDIIPKLQRYSEKLDKTTMLMNKHWVVIDDLNTSKTVYIFRANNELLLSKNGKVEKASWQYIDNNTLLIDINDVSFLFKQGFIDDQILALKLDGSDGFAIMIDDTLYEKGILTIEQTEDFLIEKYIKSKEVDKGSEISKKKTPKPLEVKRETPKPVEVKKKTPKPLEEKNTNSSIYIIIIIVALIIMFIVGYNNHLKAYG